MEYSDKYKKVNTESVAAQYTTTPQQAASTSKPAAVSGNVPVGQQQDNEFTKLVQSQDFQKLTKEEQLAKLKELYPNLDEAVLKSILANVSVSAQSAAEATVPTEVEQTETLTKTTEENNPEETKETAKAQQQQVSEEENTANAYAQEQGLDSIDDVIAAIKAKDASQLTDAEKMILNTFGSGKKLTSKEIKANLEKYADALDNLIPQEVIQSDEWQKKTPQEKLDARIDALLASMIPHYNELQDTAKANLKNDFIDKIATAINPGWKNAEKGDKDFSLSVVAVLAEKTENSELTIKEIFSKSPQEQLAMLAKYTGDVLDKYYINSNLKVDSLAGKSADEQLDAIAESIIKSFDPNAAISKEYKTSLINMIGKELYGDKWDDAEQQKILKQSAATKLLALKEYNDQHNENEKVSGNEFFKDIGKKYTVIESYEKNHKIALTNSQKLQRQIIKDLGREPISNNDIKAYLEKKQKNGKTLSDEEKGELCRIKLLEENLEGQSQEDFEKVMNAPITEVSETLAYHIQNKYNGDIDAYLNAEVIKDGKTLENLTIDEKRALLSSIGDYDMMEKMAGKLGYVDKQGNVNMVSVYDELGFIDTCMYISNIEDVAKRAKASSYATQCEDTRSRMFGRRVLTAATKDLPPELAEPYVRTALTGKYGEENAQELPKIQVEYGYTKEQISELGTVVANDKEIDTNVRGTYVDSTIANAPDDETRVYYGKQYSENVKDADILEYVGAASKYVENSAKKSEYNSYVETAAKNFPAETQQKITNAIKTGEVSAETRAKTSTTEGTENPQAAQTKAQTTQRSTVSAERAAAQTATVQSASVQTAARQPEAAQTTAAAQTPVSTAQTTVSGSRGDVAGTVASSAATRSASTISSSAAATSSTVSAAASTPASETVSPSVTAADETAHLEQLRDEAAQNARQTAEDINESVAEHQAQQEITEKVDQIIEELGATGNISMTDKEKIKQQIMNAGSITKVYEIVASLGAKDIFIDRLLTSGSTYAINTFIKNMDDTSVLEEMYLKASVDTVKKEILRKLPEDRIHSLIAAGKIQNLEDIDTKTILSFLNKNIGSMHEEDFQYYAQYLDKYDYERLLTRYNEAHGIENEQQQTAQTTSVQPQTHNEGAQVHQDEAAEVSAAPKAKKSAAAKPKSKPRFAKGEMRKTLADGRVIKPKETFAGISDVVDDDAFDVVPQDQTEKAMNDEVLTPGSDAWRQKYGRYDTKPQVAFTMSALEEEESDDLLSGIQGPVVANWKIKGKKPRGLNFKG